MKKMNKKGLFQSQKHVFWTALILATFVFAIGIFLGFMLENYRTSKVDVIMAQSELELLDIRIQSDLYSFSGFNCNNAIEENIRFADSIYEDAKILQNYEKGNQLSDTIKAQHQKYDLLRTLFWVNSIKLKEKCNASYHNVVYLYDYNNPRLDITAKQAVFAKILGEVKNNQGNNIMLIPIAGDIPSSSIRLMMNIYNVTEYELPVILIDDKVKITEVETAEDIEKLL